MTAPDPMSYQDPAGDTPGAGLGIRFVARLLDSILLAVLLSIVGAITGLGSVLSGSIDTTTILFNAIWVLVVVGYFAWLESSRGQTVGKMVTRLRTVGPNGANPTFEEAVRRNGWYALGIIPFIGGLAQFGVAIYIAITISQSAMNVGWHDEFAGGTRVIPVG